MIHFWATKGAKVEFGYSKHHVSLVVGGDNEFAFVVNGFDVRIYGPRGEHIASIDMAGRDVALIDVAEDVKDHFSLHASGGRYVVKMGGGLLVRITCERNKLSFDVLALHEGGDEALVGILTIERGEPCDKGDE